MKRVTFVVAVLCATLFMTSCDKSGKKAIAVADSFLSSYFKMDYEKAASYCSQEISEMLLEAVEDKDDLPDEILDKMAEASSSTTYEIVGIDDETLEDCVLVQYEVRPANAERPIVKTMYVSKFDDEWKITSLK